MMKEYKVINRWWIVVSAVIIQLCLGSIYAWGVFVKPLIGEFGWTKTEVSWAFTIVLVAYAGSMMFGGRWQDKIGPRKVATMGGLLLCIGYFLASYTTSLPWLYITYGLIGGIGVGIGYVCPIATCVKWFPDKRGLATGLAVAGFGAGALLIAPIATILVADFGWRSAFQVLGIVFGLLVVVAAQILRNPPEGWQPEGYKVVNTDGESVLEYSWQEMLKTPQFWMLWLMFSFGATAGLMVIGHLASYGIEAGLSEASAALAVGTLSFFNGSGRIMWGHISDRIGRTKTLAIVFVLLIISVLAFVQTSSFWPLAFVSGLMGLAFGGMLAVFPSITADYFGTKNVGTNYGVLFSAYGAAGIFGPLLGAQIHDHLGTYLYAAVIAAALCVIAFIITFLVKKPEVSCKEKVVFSK